MNKETTIKRQKGRLKVLFTNAWGGGFTPLGQVSYGKKQKKLAHDCRNSDHAK